MAPLKFVVSETYTVKCFVLKRITKVKSTQDRELQELEVESTKGGELNR
jgi:ribosomal protein S26